MSIGSHLIHCEDQFNKLRSKFLDYAGCASDFKFSRIKNVLAVIISTQRTGSTLLCQDISSALNLSYSPTESFIPLLNGIFKKNIKPEEVGFRIDSILQSFSHDDLSVVKFMIDYVGWLGFFCIEYERAKELPYSILSASFLEMIGSKTMVNKSILIRLDRKNKYKQSVSRFINSLGMPTHIITQEDATNFEILLQKKIMKFY